MTVDGERDILGLWAGNGGEDAKLWLGGSPRLRIVACRTSVSLSVTASRG